MADREGAHDVPPAQLAFGRLQVDMTNTDFGRYRKPRKITADEQRYADRAIREFRRLHTPHTPPGRSSSQLERYNIGYAAIFADRNQEQPVRRAEAEAEGVSGSVSVSNMPAPSAVVSTAAVAGPQVDRGAEVVGTAAGAAPQEMGAEVATSAGPLGPALQQQLALQQGHDRQHTFQRRVDGGRGGRGGGMPARGGNGVGARAPTGGGRGGGRFARSGGDMFSYGGHGGMVSHGGACSGGVFGSGGGGGMFANNGVSMHATGGGSGLHDRSFGGGDYDFAQKHHPNQYFEPYQQGGRPHVWDSRTGRGDNRSHNHNTPFAPPQLTSAQEHAANMTAVFQQGQVDVLRNSIAQGGFGVEAAVLAHLAPAGAAPRRNPCFYHTMRGTNFPVTGIYAKHDEALCRDVQEMGEEEYGRQKRRWARIFKEYEDNCDAADAERG